MTSTQLQFLRECEKGAQTAGHIFPRMAACEAALESGYGTSELFRKYLNAFGLKQHHHPVFGSVVLPTKEVLNGAVVAINATWVVYPTVRDCFTDRMSTLTHLSPIYPHYAAALAATDPLTYVREVSKSWSTDPARADKCISIYNAYNAQHTPNVLNG